MNKKLLIAIVVVVLVLIAWGMYSSRQSNVSPEAKNELIMQDRTQPLSGVGSYEFYSPEKIARADSGDVVLFFKASWCPTCRAVDADIKANLTDIPENLSILEIDYDRSEDLKRKYGVVYQHTFVQVDKDGNLIKKWSGSPTLSSLVAQVN